MNKTINWGIIGCGRIAQRFAEGLRPLSSARIAAAASLTPGKAESFAAEFKIPKAYSDYKSLAADPSVDVVYVANVHNAHHAASLIALNKGKAVLCEKPFALNARQSAEMIDTARKAGLFLMEAMWTRFLPASRQLKELIDQSVIGDVRHLRAEFGFRTPWNPEDRLHSRKLAGGALLDLGIYPVSFARWIFGKSPESIQSTASIGRTGVDEQSSYQFSYSGGRSAQLFSSFKVPVPDEALIAGTQGFIRVPEFFHPREFTVFKPGGRRKKHKLPYRSTGLNCEAQEVMDCLQAGKIESTVMPLDETLEIMQTLDALRAQWDLVYPEEESKTP